MPTTKIDVLDHGYVLMKDNWVLGDGDLEIVNDARVSFNKESQELSVADIKLIKFLGNHEHTAPFRGSVGKVEMYAPLMTSRQIWKYVIGSQFEEPKLQDSMQVWSESSRRYLTETPTFYTPQEDEWRGVPLNKKQGSNGFVDVEFGANATRSLMEYCEMGERLYNEAISVGICVEQARLFLPAYGMYVRFRWTASLQTFAHFIHQRIADDAQKEIQMYAKALYTLTEPIWTNALRALLTDEEISRCNE